MVIRSSSAIIPQISNKKSGVIIPISFLFQGELTPSRLNPKWISSKHFVFQQDDGGLAVLDTTDNSVSLLVTNHTLVSIFVLISNFCSYKTIYNIHKQGEEYLKVFRVCRLYTLT